MSEVIAVLQCPRCSEIALMSNPLFIIKLALLCLNAWTLSAGKSFSTRIFFNCLLVKLLSFHIVWYCFIESCTKFAPKHNFRHRENPETVVVSGFLSFWAVNLRPIIAWRTEVRDGRPSDRTSCAHLAETLVFATTCGFDEWNLSSILSFKVCVWCLRGIVMW